MKHRCTGTKTPGHFTSFDCRLDDGHDGDCSSFGADAMVVEQSEQFGPFVRLVPGKETP